MSPTAFADKININRSSLTHIFSGRNQPSLDVAKKILIAFPEISTEWLIMGMGNMIQEVPAPADTPTPVKTVDNMQQTDLFSGTEDGLTDQDVTETTETESIIEEKDVVEQEPAAQETAVNAPQQAIVEPVKEETVSRILPWSHLHARVEEAVIQNRIFRPPHRAATEFPILRAIKSW